MFSLWLMEGHECFFIVGKFSCFSSLVCHRYREEECSWLMTIFSSLMADLKAFLGFFGNQLSISVSESV